MVSDKDVKAIIVDLDRTMLHNDKTVSPYTLAVLEKCKRNGIRIMAATARPLRTTMQYCEKINFDAMVVSNGARVICGAQQTDHGICFQSAEKLLDALHRYPELRITLETGDCAYSNKPIAEYETTISDHLAAVAKAEGVLKILVGLDTNATLSIVSTALTEDLYYTVSNGNLVQIMDKSATKWNGIKAMLNTCNCSSNETAYFGDDHDDIEAIKMCGIGIAVSNGIEEVKAVADYVTQSNDEDGVAKFIVQQLLEKE